MEVNKKNNEDIQIFWTCLLAPIFLFICTDVFILKANLDTLQFLSILVLFIYKKGERMFDIILIFLTVLMPLLLIFNLDGMAKKVAVWVFYFFLMKILRIFLHLVKAK